MQKQLPFVTSFTVLGLVGGIAGACAVISRMRYQLPLEPLSVGARHTLRFLPKKDKPRLPLPLTPYVTLVRPRTPRSLTRRPVGGVPLCRRRVLRKHMRAPCLVATRLFCLVCAAGGRLLTLAALTVQRTPRRAQVLISLHMFTAILFPNSGVVTRLAVAAGVSLLASLVDIGMAATQSARTIRKVRASRAPCATRGRAPTGQRTEI